jgi:polar amino acid transport system substrate-binding protein
MDLTVAVAGSPPFVVDTADQTGISMEIWEDVASRLGWPYQTRYYEDVPQALQALEQGRVDAVVGPVSITADRAQKFQFTQPYFLSSLSILSRTDPPTSGNVSVHSSVNGSLGQYVCLSLFLEE